MEYRSLSHQDIQEFLVPDETAAELLHRLRNEQLTTGVTFLDQHVQLRPGCVLEVCGPAGCGKTTLLVQVAAHCVIAAWRGNQAGSSGGQMLPPLIRQHAIVVDLDGKFDGLQLFQVMRRQLSSAFPHQWDAYQQAEAALGGESLDQPLPVSSLPAHLQAALTGWQEMEGDCLARVHVVKAYNSVELLAGLLAARRLARGWKAAGEGCAVVMLDNVAAFTYLDKAVRQQPYSTAPVTPLQGLVAGQAFYGGGSVQGLPAATSHLTMSKVHNALAALLGQMSQELRALVIATRSAQVTLQEPDVHGPARLNAREFMADSWVKCLTHRLLLGPPVTSARPGVGTTTGVPAQIWKGSQPASALLHVFVQSSGLHAIAS